MVGRRWRVVCCLCVLLSRPLGQLVCTLCCVAQLPQPSCWAQPSSPACPALTRPCSRRCGRPAGPPIPSAAPWTAARGRAAVHCAPSSTVLSSVQRMASAGRTRWVGLGGDTAGRPAWVGDAGGYCWGACLLLIATSFCWHSPFPLPCPPCRPRCRRPVHCGSPKRTCRTARRLVWGARSLWLGWTRSSRSGE